MRAKDSIGTHKVGNESLRPKGPYFGSQLTEPLRCGGQSLWPYKTTETKLHLTTCQVRLHSAQYEAASQLMLETLCLRYVVDYISASIKI